MGKEHSSKSFHCQFLVKLETMRETHIRFRAEQSRITLMAMVENEDQQYRDDKQNLINFN